MNRDFVSRAPCTGGRAGRCWLAFLLLGGMALSANVALGQAPAEVPVAPELPTDDQADPTALPEKLLGYQFKFDEFESQPGDKEILASREWTDLTEVDVILDESRREEIREVLKTAREEKDLHFLVITVKAEKIRDYLQVTAALLRERLALEEGGIIVCTEAPATQITAYTTLLETRLGSASLRSVDKKALAASTQAVGVNERALTLVRSVTELIAERKAALEQGSLSAAEKLFAPSVDVILTSEQEAARGRGPATPATPATEAELEGAKTPATPGASGSQPASAPTAPAAARATGAASRQEPGVLGAFLAGMGALLVLIAAGLLTRLAVGSIRQRSRRAKNTASEVVAIREEPRPGATSATTKDGETAGTAAKGAIKPRALDKRRVKRKPENGAAASALVREDIREWVQNLEKLSDAHRPSGAAAPQEYYNPDVELNPLAMGEIHSHYRALFRMLPPTSRNALSESLESLLEEVKNPSAPGTGKEY